MHSRALGRRGDVLDADLEADRRLALGQVLEARGSPALRSIIAIIPGVERTLDADRAADVGDQPVLDLELVVRSMPGLELASGLARS